MHWKRLVAGTVIRCDCGGSHFGEVLPGTVLWLLSRPPHVTPPKPCILYRCRQKRCGRAYWGVSVESDKAQTPPEVAA